jgi:hypothetical protein
MPLNRVLDRTLAAAAIAAAAWIASITITGKTLSAGALVVETSRDGKAEPGLTSGWRAEPVTVDGKPDEWSALVPFEDAHLAVGVSNDDRTLQIAVTSSDQARRRQLVAAGLLVWLDPGGGKKRAVGIRFPGEFAARPRGEGGEQRPHDRARSGSQPGEPPTLPPLTWFELRGPRDEDVRRLEQSAVTSIRVARGLNEGMLVLELQIPLAKDPATGFGVGAEPGRVLGLGLETPSLEKADAPAPDANRGGHGSSGGGMGGGMGGMGGGGMGRGGMGGGRHHEGPNGERPERAKPLKLWTTVQLAARNGS